MKFQFSRVEPYRHIIAICSFFYLMTYSYAFLTDQEIIQVININDYMPPGMKFSKNLNYQLLHFDTFTNYLYTTFWVQLFYISKYALVGYLLETTNPIPKTEYRRKMTDKEKSMGFWALFWVVILTTLLMWKLEPKMPYYGYYDTHEVTVKNFLISCLVYMVAFDAWFWFTHMMSHHPFLFRHLHSHHHQFLEPSGFGQDAVHPIEALIQGPWGHYLGSIFYPIHPVAHILFGLLTSVFALCAHDGRWDVNYHWGHHWYGDCNFGLFFPFWDWVFGTRYSKEKYPVQYVPTWVKEANENEDVRKLLLEENRQRELEYYYHYKYDNLKKQNQIKQQQKKQKVT